MFKFLFVMFFFFILLVFLMGFSILRTFKNILFGSGSSGKKGEQRRQTSGYSSDARSNSSAFGCKAFGAYCWKPLFSSVAP